MRYYAVLGTDEAPHIIAEFVDRHDAEQFDVVDSYSEAEMHTHPLLTEALEQWRRGEDTPRWRSRLAELLGLPELHNRVRDCLAQIQSYEDDIAGLPDEPRAVLAREMQVAMTGWLPRLVAFREDYTDWSEPRSEMELERQAYRDKLDAARKATQRA